MRCTHFGSAGSIGPIVRLALPNNNLTGALPDLSGLSYLEYLALTANTVLNIDIAVSTRLDQLTEFYLPPAQLQKAWAHLPPFRGPLKQVKHEDVRPVAAPPTMVLSQWAGAARWWRVRQHSYLDCVATCEDPTSAASSCVTQCGEPWRVSEQPV